MVMLLCIATYRWHMFSSSAILYFFFFLQNRRPRVVSHHPFSPVPSPFFFGNVAIHQPYSNFHKFHTKKKNGIGAGKFLSGTENMKFWILVFFSFFFFLFFLGGLSCGF